MKSTLQSFSLVGSGIYAPCDLVSSSELDNRLGKPNGTAEKTSQVLSRRFVKDELPSRMSAIAILKACDEAKCNPDDLDLIISASPAKDQLIPYQAAAIQRELDLDNAGIPCFDVDTTCLSFVTALEIASLYLNQGRYRRIAIVSAECPSQAMNWNDMNTATLLGDGAAAVVLEANMNSTSGLVYSQMRTYSSGYNFCQIRAGSLRWNFRRPPPSDDYYMFYMEGKNAFKLVAQKIKEFMNEFWRNAGVNHQDIDMVVPHQASHLGLTHVQKILQIPDEKFVNILADHGNQGAASIPTALHYARMHSLIKPGSLVLLLGTSAGLSIGAALVRM